MRRFEAPLKPTSHSPFPVDIRKKPPNRRADNRAGTITASLAVALTCFLAPTGCGGGSDDSDTAAGITTGTPTTQTGGEASHEHPPDAVGTDHTHDDQEESLGPAATEASPEAEAEGPEASGELSDQDGAAVSAVVREYIAALNRHAAARVCALLAPGALDPGELPKRRGGCRPSLRASIGTEPRGGGPAWRRTSLGEMSMQALDDDRARVTATVTSRFSDRNYVSVEDDVIYLERAGGRWLLAKPSGTFYRAVGYPEPPLHALTPPAGWR
jgi:hypothetical protein